MGGPHLAPEELHARLHHRAGGGRRAQPAFEQRNCRVIGLSVAPVASHHQWEGNIAEVTGHAVTFPMIADPDRVVSTLYDMIHPNANDTLTVRSVFIIGPDNRVKLTLTYPASTGRNFDEILRALDSLQLTANWSVSTPADWRPGEDVIIANTIPDDEAERRFPKGFVKKKPYLRVTPQPDR